MPIKFGKYMLGDKPPIQLTLPQLMTVLAPQKHKFLEWSRGGGKSTVISKSVSDKPIQMPRGAFFLVGETYNQILTRTLPSTIAGLEMLGYYQGVHYFVGRKAPAKWKWEQPYQPPLNYDHAIHWITGACTHLISLDMPNSGRGLNTDGGDGDEAALFDYEKLHANVLATNRGNLHRFGKCPLHHSTMFASSVPMTNKGKWLYKMEQEAIADPSKIFYLRADSRHNIHNLGKDWFAEQKRILTTTVYNAEVLNIRPDRVEGGFYANFDEAIHTADNYNNSYLLNIGFDMEKVQNRGCLADGDLKPDMLIDVSFDWGTAINTIVAEQEYGGVSHGLSSMYLKAPHTVDELVDKFCQYYSAHKHKTVKFWYDHTAISKGNTGVSFEDIVKRTFIKHGWLVISKNVGRAAGHHDKFLFWSAMLGSQDSRLPRFTLHKTNCKHLIISVQQAGVRQGKNGFEKDKRPEHQKNAIHEETTHFSDAMDTLWYFKYSPRLSSYQGDFELPTIQQ